MRNESDYATQALQAVDGLLAEVGIDRATQAGGALRFTGKDPDFDTPHHIVMASAAAIGAQATGAAALWRANGGHEQNIEINLTQAAAALHPAQYQRQSGYPIPALSLARELKADFYKTADNRWFFPIGSYPHLRNGVLDALNCPNNETALAAAIGKWRGFELEEEFAKRKLPGVLARTREEWLDHEQGQILAKSPTIRIEKIGDSAPELHKPGRRPLEHLRVLDAAHVIAGPVVARTLAEQGADVLRVSSPMQPDPMPQTIDTGIGKRCAYLELKDGGDAARLRELCREADVFVQSWRPGAMERLGFGAEDLARIRPGIIYVSVSCYGQEGPWAERGGFEQLGQVVCGLAHDEGRDGRPRVVPTYLLNDYVTAYLGATGVYAALLRRAKEGGSYHVKVALTRTSMWTQSLGMRKRPAPANAVAPATLNPELETRDSPYGKLEQLPPVAQFSCTAARWELPPSPLGACRAEWLR
jgi:crotonobetainyl-CoA:carnitine CoA-transferase CaiB-like acyl-CoA transferase